MARKTNKARVLELAAQLDVEVVYGRMGEEGFEVGLYGYKGHMAFDPMGGGHTAITNQTGTGIRTEAGIWGAALQDLRQFEPCEEDCHCRATDDVDMIVTDDDDAPRRDGDLAPERVAPIVTDADGFPIVSMPYIITDTDSGAKYFGTAISSATPFETMRTMVALALGVSRETVRLWETDNVREYAFDTRRGHHGTVRFSEPARNPYRPAPVTLTHSNHS